MKHWYALYAKARKEEQVHNSLEARGFETYLPSVKIRTDGNHKVVRFFSRYLFVRVDLSNGLSSPRSISGSRAIVSLGGEPATVLEDGISMMKGRWPTYKNRANRTCVFQRGDEMVVNSGPLRGFEVVFDQSTY